MGGQEKQTQEAATGIPGALTGWRKAAMAAVIEIEGRACQVKSTLEAAGTDDKLRRKLADAYSEGGNRAWSKLRDIIKTGD